MSVASDFYSAQAETCMTLAAATSLVQVRDQRLRAASVWRLMAEKAVRTDEARAEREARSTPFKNS